MLLAKPARSFASSLHRLSVDVVDASTYPAPSGFSKSE
jgi:hypothetical protein